ncbi:phosphoglycerate kinase [Candidatus Phytoplasma phoenicium]|uniref:Phosphoglycerate kinase n=1 Tax=Candidatus Phytoplasma phoenicium TaxID=198422 RepID=A0A0L0MKD9_9MOLU|nr:phosphoglycerate kinase [Candidatus Phytoplasma phoenicium]KND62746.1 Phosphoglycerate kinase [Candidatus Phytoplasma phoenicium]
MKKNLIHTNIKNKKILLRVDLNIPIIKGVVQKNNKIKAILPTLKYLIKQNCKIILLSHLGRIKTAIDKQKLSLKPIAEKLSFYLKKQVIFVPFTRGPLVEKQIDLLLPGNILMLENTRFEDLNGKKESENELNLGKYWASLGDVFVNDAFGMVHRKHASNIGIANHISQKCFGFLMEKEMNMLNKIVKNPKKPLVMILGGAKLSDKIKVIHKLLQKVDFLLIGGAMCFTFLKAKGLEVGHSLIDPSSLSVAQKLLSSPQNHKIILCEDIVCGKKFSTHTETIICPYNQIPKELMGMDIGPQTIKRFTYYLQKTKTILWNGPLGICELEKFNQGTKIIAKKIISLNPKPITIIGGGDSAVAILKLGLNNQFTHISTGGGAFLEYLEKTSLPGIKCITNNEKI